MLPLRCLFAFHGPAGSHGWQRLDFVAMQTEPAQYRRFAQGELRFDTSQARLQLADGEYTLAAGEPEGWQASVSAWLATPG